MSKLRGSFWSSAFAASSEYTISRIWRKLNTIVVLHYFGSVRITKVIRDESADLPIVPLRKSIFPFSVRAAIRAIRAAGRPLNAPHSGCLCGNPVINASGVVSPRSVAGFSRFSLRKPPLSYAAKKSIRQAKRESVSPSSRASSLFSRDVPRGTRSKLNRRVVRRADTTLPESPQEKPIRKNTRLGQTSHLPYVGEAALDEFLRWIEEVNPHPSMVAIPAPISFSAMPTTAWCSPADTTTFGCRLEYHAEETSFRNEGKRVRYVYVDVSSAANRPRTVSPFKCGHIFPSGSALGADVPSIRIGVG